MRSWLVKTLLICIGLTAVSACTYGPDRIAEFWRPISEPNLLMDTEKAQAKLDFDLSQCRCGIFPENMTHTNVVEFQPDRQRLAETSVIVTPSDDHMCRAQPSLVVSECMRGRGWEVTNCSGRIPLPGGGSLCASYTFPSSPEE